MFFISWENIVWLSYVICYLKVYNIRISLKIVNLPFWIDVGYREQILTLKYKLKNSKQKMQNKLPKKTHKKENKKWKIKHKLTEKGPSFTK